MLTVSYTTFLDKRPIVYANVIIDLSEIGGLKLQLADLLDKLEESSCYIAKDIIVGFRDEFGLMNRIV